MFATVSHSDRTSTSIDLRQQIIDEMGLSDGEVKLMDELRQCINNMICNEAQDKFRDSNLGEQFTRRAFVAALRHRLRFQESACHKMKIELDGATLSK